MTPSPSGPGLLGRRRIGEVAALALICAAGLVVADPRVAHAEATQVVVLAIAESVDQVLTNIRNWIIGLSAGLATVFLTIGGARYLIAGGDPGEVERARAALRSAAFGYAFALLAPLLVEVLKGIVGA
ncbi:pilin [Pseudonocardia sp. TRM90224]|uniref:pilin n=1 Tax=Pseudonocardia sp. TRM90224 TaxID=2812678 RepID=UPI001E47733D|nr:pilin [Pseudonocardia sp. TRM90224]